MCGIAGIIDFAGRPIERGVLDRLCQTLSHRGPDDHGTWQWKTEGWSVGLAHTRLAVIDPAPEAHQPMTAAEGRWAIAYNGELYNYREVRDRLAEPMRTASDTEVFLRACQVDGPAALKQFDGMWAAAVVDTAGRCGHISRDPMGIKPLYYAVGSNRLVFASELASLMQLIDWPVQVDPQAVACYLQMGFIPHPMTIYRGVHKLPPGYVLRFTANGAEPPERYFRLNCPPAPPPTYDDACRRVRELVETAVQRQCIADVPLGAFLSGGLDSSVVVASMAARQGTPVKTFSIGYADHARYDETQYARCVARHLGTEHHEFRLSFADVLNAVEPMLNHLGEPFADSSLLPTSVVSQQTRKHVTVALSGDGGDELFGGYWRYLGHHYLRRYNRVPALLRHAIIEPLLRLVPEARSTRGLDRLRQVRKLVRAGRTNALGRHLAWARLIEPELAGALLGEESAAAAWEDIQRTYREAAGQWRDTFRGEPLLQRILLADLGVGLPADMLHKVDTASMYHSLEVRVPLLSADVVDYVTALPLEYKICGTQGKRILRDAFRDALPEEVFTRRKMGFEVPVGEFLRNELRDLYTSTVTPDALGSLGINAQAATRAFNEHLHSRRDRSELLWGLLVLCWWQRTIGKNNT